MKTGKFFKKVTLATTISLALSQSVWAMPSGGTVESGTVTGFSANPASGATFTANGASIINWDAFGIAAGENMIFNTENGALLNRVTGGNISEIFGTLNQIGGNPMYLVNPNGILVGKGAVINANNMVLSTLEMTSSNFLIGNYILTTPSGKDIAAPIQIKGAKINNSPISSTIDDGYGNQYQAIQGNGNFTAIGGTIDIADGVTFDIGTSSNLHLYAANDAKVEENAPSFGNFDATNNEKNIINFSDSKIRGSGAFDILGGTVNISGSKLYYGGNWSNIQSYNHNQNNDLWTSTGTVTIENSDLFSTSEYGWIQIMGKSVKISGSTIRDPYPTIYAVKTRKNHADTDTIMFDFEMTPSNRISISDKSSINGKLETTLIGGTITTANKSTISSDGELYIVASTAASKKSSDYSYYSTGTPGTIAVSEDSTIIHKGLDITDKIATTRIIPDEPSDPSDITPTNGANDKENIANGKAAMNELLANAKSADALAIATRDLVQRVNNETVDSRAKAAQVSGILLAIQENKDLADTEKTALQREVSQIFTPTQTANAEGNSTTDGAAQLGTAAATGDSQPKDANLTISTEETSNIAGL